MKGALPLGYITPTELNVWRHIALGHQNRGIASLLGVSVNTVEKHRGELCRKLDAHNAADLVRRAVAHGVITVTVSPLVQAGPARRTRYVIPEASSP